MPDPWIRRRRDRRASGIGRSRRFELAARGCDLALADRDETGCRRWPPRSTAPFAEKSRHTGFDVSEPQQIADFAQAANQPIPA